MNNLSQYFNGVALKRLSPVEVDVNSSNQHEFNGTVKMRQILGEADNHFETVFLYLTDQNDAPVVEKSSLTWYDARRKARDTRGIMRYEYRLYFPANRVLQCAAADDLLVIAKRPDNRLLAIVTKKNTTIEQQILWLFSFSDPISSSFLVKSDMGTGQEKTDFAVRIILEQIGVEPKELAPNFLEQMLALFKGTFPETAVFSDYARNTVKDQSVHDDPDAALIAWMEQEEILFRTLEKHLLQRDLRKLYNAGDVEPEEIIKLIQSALQRRKSRAGLALENHVKKIFHEHHIKHTRGGTTEKKLKPDFIFPSISHYHDDDFANHRLTMLACKSTCKDRWRQILNEAARIPSKHLLTLEPSISENQTHEMEAAKVQLVVPRGLHTTYTSTQQTRLLNLSEFIKMIQERQQSQ